MKYAWKRHRKKHGRGTVETDGDTVEEVKAYIPLPKDESLVVDGGEGVLGVQL